MTLNRLPCWRWMIVAAINAFAVTGPAHAIDFTTSAFTLSIGPDGKPVGLLDLATGRDRIETLPQYRTEFCRVIRNGTSYRPTAVIANGSQWTFTFGTLAPAPVVSISIAARDAYVVFTVDAVTNPSSIDQLYMADFRTAHSLTAATFRFLTYDDAGVSRCVGITALDPWVNTLVGPESAGGYLWAITYPNLPYHQPVSMVGRKAALFVSGGTKEAIYAACAHIEVGEAVPLGVTARNDPALTRSAFLWDQFEYADRDQVLQYTQAAGLGRMLIQDTMWHTRQHTAETPNGWSVNTLRAWIAQCQTAGMAVGAHMFPFMLYKQNLDHVMPGCDARIRRDAWLTLAAPVAASQTDGLIVTTMPPTGWPLADGWRDICIGQEIIQYSTLKTDFPPYGFLGPFTRAKNQTGGPGALGPQNLAAGSAVGHLMPFYDDDGYEWDLSTGGVGAWCSEIATLTDQLRFDSIYCDGLESNIYDARYIVSAAQYEMYSAMSFKPRWMEASGATGWFSWPLTASVGQIDYRWEHNVIDDVNSNVTAMLHEWNIDFRHQLGWPMLSSPYNLSEHIQPDQLEYVLSRSVAFDVPVVFLVRMDRLRVMPYRDVNLRLIHQYEDLRLSGALSAPERAAIQQPNRMYMMFDDGQGARRIAAVAPLPLAGFESMVRGYVSTQTVGGSYFATIWPLPSNANMTLYLNGVLPGDISVTDGLGGTASVTEVATGVLRVPIRRRIYIRLDNIADPQALFANATVR